MDIKATRRTQTIKGTTYVYEDYPYWDAEKKQTRHKREYIGKLDSDGSFIPNKVYQARQLLEEANNGKEESPVATDVSVADSVEQPVMAQRSYYGASYLLDHIGKQTGVVEDLKQCFPEHYQQILSLAYYLVMENQSPMYRFEKWSHTHHHPLGEGLSSQRISELLDRISEEAKLQFFRLQSRRRLEQEYLAYDTTSISSYSELISHVRYGHNKDGDPLPQVNLALVFGEQSGLPVYYRKLAGNIADVSTIRKLLEDVAFLRIKHLKLVMDRGFYSARNINALYRDHCKFIVGAKKNVSFVARLLNDVREKTKDFLNYSTEHRLYCMSRKMDWPYEEYDKQGEVLRKSKRRMYAHVYYNGQRGEEEKERFIFALAQAEQALLDDNCTEYQQTLCEKYFIVKTTPKRGTKISYNEEAIREHVKNYGYFVLLSNEIKDPEEALALYRNKDLIEKAFGNLKQRLNLKRMAVSSSERLDGKLFVQFVGLIYMSYIHKVMKEQQLYKNHSLQGLLDELDVIERFDYGGQRHHCSEITKKQEDIYRCFGTKSPNML